MTDKIIRVKEKTHNKLMWFKIKAKAKNLDAVIKELIKNNERR